MATPKNAVRAGAMAAPAHCSALETPMTETRPWLRFYGKLPHSLSYPELTKWSCPRAIEFCAELPKTRVGKIDYKLLVQAHAARQNAQEKTG
jgi:acyl-CoA synthetase (AMP-forming)/AMP-acid ligase II